MINVTYIPARFRTLKEIPWNAVGIPWEDWTKRQPLCALAELQAWIKTHDPETLRLAAATGRKAR